MTNNVGLTFSVGNTIPQFTSILKKTIGIDDTKYQYRCSYSHLLKSGPPPPGYQG